VTRLHVLTACTRPQNLPVLANSILAAMCDPWELCWHIRFDPAREHLGGHKLKNDMLAQIDDGWVLFLDDDTVMHPDVLRHVAEHLDAAGVVVSQDRTASLGHMLWAAPQNMRLGGVDIGQVVLRRELIGDVEMPPYYGGDGVFLGRILLGRDDVVYLNEVLSYYNVLEEGVTCESS
jgi:hypothetical protein